ncbi:MAG: hypothetical protein ACRDSP_08740 [Pseudonocardiaceae bacterium]
MATLLAVGLLVAVPLGGCTNSERPASSTPTAGIAPSLPAAPPLPLPHPETTGPLQPEPGLGAAAQGRLTEARRVGAPWVVLLVSVVPNRSNDIAAGLRGLGAVLGISPGPGYLRATVPTGNVERAAALPGVTGVDIEQVIPPNSPRPTG